jgi:hypothetical protein
MNDVITENQGDLKPRLFDRDALDGISLAGAEDI